MGRYLTIAIFFLTILLTALLIPSSSLNNIAQADSTLRVDDTKVQLIWEDNISKLILPIKNSTGKLLTASVHIEILDNNDKVLFKIDEQQQIKQGANKITIPVNYSFIDQPNIDLKEVLWYRLKYQIDYRSINTSSTNNSLSANNNDQKRLSNIISLSKIDSNAFEIFLLSPRNATPGRLYKVTLSTLQVGTHKPIKGVSIKGELKNADADKILIATAITDQLGYAALDFNLPDENIHGYDIKITGQQGMFAQSVDDWLYLNKGGSIYLNTDKSIYQPEQVIHIRALVFDQTKHALANTHAQITITDPEDTKLYSAEVTTSKFGIVNTEWRIPANSRLGEYQVTLNLTDRDLSYDEASLNIKISRYELPNFAVQIKPDRNYYLTGQDAIVDISAEYLFGKPVKNGHVRVVAESDRKWDAATRTYKIIEGNKYEGEADDKGHFIAHIDLKSQPLDDYDYKRYKDITYTAYYTDASTKRTEQLNFDLRITEEPIHIYLSTESVHADTPTRFYLIAYYADGTPAECKIGISYSPKQDGDSSKKITMDDYRSPFLTVQTNKYGVARVDYTFTGKQVAIDNKLHSKNLFLLFAAQDRQGNSAHKQDALYITDYNLAYVRPKHSLLHNGESIDAVITATKPALFNVQLIHHGEYLNSKWVRATNGSAEVSFPYQPNYQGPYIITATAYDFSPEDIAERVIMSDSCAVFYPANAELNLNANFDQKIYRPGDNAKVALSLSNAQGNNVAGVLGAVVIDKAVELRARSESSNNHYYAGFLDGFLQKWYSPERIGGLSGNDITKLDINQPFPDGIDLVAELFLQTAEYNSGITEGKGYLSSSDGLYRDQLESQLKPVKDIVMEKFLQANVYPTNITSLKKILNEHNLDLAQVVDAWGVSYQINFEAVENFYKIEFSSAGPDKLFKTTDDFKVTTIAIPYFQNYGKLIDKVVQDYHIQTGLYLHDEITFKHELKKVGVNFDQLHDAQGNKYTIKFGVDGSNNIINILGGGNKIPYLFEYPIWTSSIDYFTTQRKQIADVLNNYLLKGNKFPEDENTFKAILKEGNIDLDGLRDSWNQPLYIQTKIENRLGGNPFITTSNRGGHQLEVRVPSELQQFTIIYLRSCGPDGKLDTIDDFSLADFSHIIETKNIDQKEQLKEQLKDQQEEQDKFQSVSSSAIVSSTTGAICGVVQDELGAVLAGAEVSIIEQENNTVNQTTITNESGAFCFSLLKPGVYKIICQASGFNKSIIETINIYALQTINTEIIMSTGGSMDLIYTTSSQVSISAKPKSPETLKNSNNNFRQLSTPRVRQYFPETLYWQPELITDDNGHAEMQFKLADNITTWKMAVIASTVDGRIGITEQEFQAFQPFFIEHDPPQILTKGDEISLPVILRNYLTDDQKMRVEMKPNSWSTLIDGPVKESNVIANDATKAIFTFNATRSIKDGKQEVMATSLSSNNRDANDAISKPVSVHPDGVEVDRSSCQLINDRAKLEINIAEDASTEMRYSAIKIYPSLIAHGFEAIEGILQRPYGCGEQTISSTYPNLLVLKFIKQQEIDAPAIKTKAQKYLQQGYERLVGYRGEDGGFTYWGRDASDLALTVYALRFLGDAKDFIDIDEDLVNKALIYILNQMNADGSWKAHSYWDKQEDIYRSQLLTALIVRVLVDIKLQYSQSEILRVNNTPLFDKAVKLGLNYLDKDLNNSEPYLLANYALAALNNNEPERATKAITILRSLAQNETHDIYWKLKKDTPFYSWGLPGNLETSALVVKALIVEAQLNHRNPINDELINKGLQFLLHYKDRYGVWYSTQTTINVIDALLAASLDPNTNNGANSSNNNSDNRITIMINGSIYKEISLPDKKQSIAPITLELGELIKNGNNSVELIMNNSREIISAQLMASYYQPWNSRYSAINEDREHNKYSNDRLKIAVKYDKTDLNIGEDVAVNVAVNKSVSQGYGMLLAEIGLPPGADVDRASLDSAMEKSNYEICYYDILPDKVIFYLWPRNQKINFQFKFKLRYGINAKTAQSQIYDYYNATEKVVIAPTKFVVH